MKQDKLLSDFSNNKKNSVYVTLITNSPVVKFAKSTKVCFGGLNFGLGGPK